MSKPSSLPGSTLDHNALVVALCAQVLPIWARQLASSRSQSETAVAEMLAAFAEIGPHLDMATRQSGQITTALAHGTGGITGLADACEQALQPVLDGLNPEAGTAIARVLTMIRDSVDALERISKPFERETQLVGEQVERMYKGFQYQDRISQMMTLLHEDIERLVDTLESRTTDIDAAAWLQRLESKYVMTEQRHHHTAAGDKAVTDDDETTFF